MTSSNFRDVIKFTNSFFDLNLAFHSDQTKRVSRHPPALETMCIASTTEIRSTESHETRGNRKASAIAQHKPYWSATSQKVVRQRQDKAGQPKDSRPCEGSNQSWLLQQAPKPQRDTVTKEEWQQLMLERRQERWDHWQAHAVRNGLLPRPEHERPTAANKQQAQQPSSSADCDAGSSNRCSRGTQVPSGSCRSRRPAT